LIVDDEAIKIQQNLMTEGIVHGIRGDHRPSCDQHFTERKRQVGLHDGRREDAGSWKTNKTNKIKTKKISIGDDVYLVRFESVLESQSSPS